MAAIIAARSDAFSGMAPDAEIYNYKVLATHAALHAEDFEGALAIQHALEDGVRVVNCSWGAGPATDGMSREARACDTAWRLGLTVVKSAGNRGPGTSTLTTPADAEGVITVGATDSRGGSIPDYSSRGPTADGQPPAAPGAGRRPRRRADERAGRRRVRRGGLRHRLRRTARVGARGRAARA
jgi:serine protease AprX